jgi:peptidyl-tRNA hydrolase
MHAGKAASQFGHAALGSFLKADSTRQQEYHRDGLGTKICLKARDLAELYLWQGWADKLGLPHFLVEDTGRNTTFGGLPTISALGIGPLYAHEAKGLSSLKLL